MQYQFDDNMMMYDNAIKHSLGAPRLMQNIRSINDFWLILSQIWIRILWSRTKELLVMNFDWIIKLNLVHRVQIYAMFEMIVVNNFEF